MREPIFPSSRSSSRRPELTGSSQRPLPWAPSSPGRIRLASCPRAPAQLCPSALSQNFLYKCVGTALGAASSKDVVRKQLRELLEAAGHQEEAEREVTAALPRRPRRPHSARACVLTRARPCLSGRVCVSTVFLPGPVLAQV